VAVLLGADTLAYIVCQLIAIHYTASSNPMPFVFQLINMLSWVIASFAAKISISAFISNSGIVKRYKKSTTGAFAYAVSSLLTYLIWLSLAFISN